MKNIHVILLVLLLAIPRFFFLDQDVPSYMIGGLSQEDEAYYCLGGINKFLKDENRVHPDFTKSDIEAIQVINTPTTYMSLKIFGNNYYGLRVPVVFCSILMILLLSLLANRQGLSTLSVSMIIVFLSTEFYSFLLGRFYNPQIFGMLFITLILFILLSKKIRPSMGAFFVGLFCSLMVLGVYAYSVFLVMGILLWYLWSAVTEKKIKNISFIIGGGLAGILLWIICCLALKIDFNGLLENIVAHGGGVEEVSDGEKIGFFKKAVLSITQLVSTNFFRYSLFLLPVFVLLVFYSITTFRSNPVSRLFILIFVSFLLQNFFIQSYPFKKQVIFYPVLIAFAVMNAKDIIRWLETNVQHWKSIVLAIISSGCIYYSFKLNNSMQYWSGFDYGYYVNIPKWVAWFGLIVALTITVIVFGYKYLNKRKNALTFVIAISILPSSILVSKQFYVDKTFLVKESLADMGKTIENKYLIQEFSHSFQFYSNSIPLMSDYDRSVIAKTDIRKLYKDTDGFAVVKSFRNGNKKKSWTGTAGEQVDFCNMKFEMVKKYPLGYYDYYLLRFKE